MRRLLPVFVTALFGLSAAGAHAAPVRLQVEPVESGPSRTVRLKLSPQEGSTRASAFAAVAVDVVAPGEAVVEIPEQGATRVEVESEELWTEPQWITFRPGEPVPTVRLRLFPTATLTGRVEVPPGEDPPGDLEVRFDPSPSSPRASRPPRARIRCPIQDRKLRCVVPAGVLDLRIQAASRIPVYLWDIEVRKGTRHDLGPIALRRGASVIGWVKVEGADARPDASCRAKIAPQTYGAPDRATETVLDALEQEVTVNARGFFQIAGVRPGTYEVSAAQQGFATSRVSPVEVRNGEETEIRDPILLARPPSFQVVLDPPLDPYERPWHVLIQRKDEDGRMGEMHQGPAGPDGRWERRGLQPGHYLLLVGDPELRSRWVSETIEVTAGQTPLSISVPVLRVRGTARMGDEPLRATLWFGGRFGRRNASFSSDEEGRFEGLLPGEGTWDVDLTSDEHRLRLRLEPVEVKRPSGKNVAIVEIRVPDTRFRGEVVDEQGRPVPGAAVRTSPEGAPQSSLLADTEGRFEFRGIRTGIHRVVADSGERVGWAQVAVEEGREVPEVRVVIRRKLSFQGRVVSNKGPIPGARILGGPGWGEGLASLEETATDLEGRFSLPVPEGTRTVDLFVVAPGHAVRLLKAPFSPDSPVEIPVEPAGGILVLDFAEARRDELSPEARKSVLVHQGVVASLGFLPHLAKIQGMQQQPDPHRLILPSMEAGEYLLCTDAETQRSIRKGEEPPEARCTRGSLSPFQELVLTLPGSPG